MMDLDKLKCCAEALGYDWAIRGTENIFYIRYPHQPESAGCQIPYDPEHNDTQAFELLKWYVQHEAFLSKAVVITELDAIRYSVDGNEGPTLNQAVIEAVCEAKHG